MKKKLKPYFSHINLRGAVIMKIKWLVLLALIVAMSIMFYFMILDTSSINELNSERFKVLSLMDGNTGYYYLLSDDDSKKIQEVLMDNSYSYKFDFLPRGGWSYKLEVEYDNQRMALIIKKNEELEYRGKKYSIDKPIDFSDLISRLKPENKSKN
jgi:hypothetical protein